MLVLIAAFVAVGCDRSTKFTFPEVPPDKVVVKFFELLGEGGKLTNREALHMVSDRNSGISQDNFRRWTENYSKETKLTIIKTTLPEKRSSNGDWIAQVELEVNTPSLFGGFFTTSSKINLILDEKTNSWKIDFLAETLEEDGYRALPAEARAEP